MRILGGQKGPKIWDQWEAMGAYVLRRGHVGLSSWKVPIATNQGWVVWVVLASFSGVGGV